MSLKFDAFNFRSTLQAVWVWTVSLPVTVINAIDRNPSLQAADIIGWIMWSIGWFIETTSDQQKLSFKNSPENRGKFCNIGLWKYSRHPNYFGEVSIKTLKEQSSLGNDKFSVKPYSASQFFSKSFTSLLNLSSS